MVEEKRNNRLKMGTEARIRHVTLLQLKKKYWYMTGGSRSRFLIRFAINQLKSKRKLSRLQSKLPTKPGSRWTITFLGQKTDSSPEDDVEDEGPVSAVESESEEKVEEAEDHWDSYESSLSDDNEDYSRDPRRWEPTFSLELRNQCVDDSETATSSAQCSLETQKFTVRSVHSNAGLRRTLNWIEEHVLKDHAHHHAPLKDLVFRGSLDGTTPLLLACSDGDLEMVKYLVEKWGVAVNDTAVHYESSTSRKIEVATPVFVASYNRHFKIVEYLIGKGADISLKSRYRQYCHGMTPLLGAIRKCPSRAEYDCDGAEPSDVGTIVIPLVRLLLENGASPSTFDGYSLCSGLAAYSVNLITLLVHHGMALDEQDLRGETVLHHWANLAENNEKNSLIVVKLCVTKGANLMIRDKNGNTPILTAVESRNWKVVDFLVENDGLDRTEKIDALEMAAAIILIESDEYDSHVERAFGYLRRAFILREEKPNPIRKTPLTLESGRTIEWTTTAEVEAGIKNPKEYKIQAYLARFRKGVERSSFAGFYILDSLSACFSDLLEQRRFDDIRDVLWASLDTMDLMVWLSNSTRSDIIIGVVKHLISMMSQLENGHHLFIADTFKKPFEFILEKIPFECFTGDFADDHDILLGLITYLARNAKFLIDEDIKESLCRLVAQENRLQSRPIKKATFLHKACLHPDDLSAIRLLLLSGANPNADDVYGYGPIHILATQYRRFLAINPEVVGSAARILLEYGAHLCKVNDDAETAADVWREGENGDLNDLPDWLREEDVKKLKCQSARVITSQNIPYDESELPAILHPFVDAHRP